MLYLGVFPACGGHSADSTSGSRAGQVFLEWSFAGLRMEILLFCPLRHDINDPYGNGQSSGLILAYSDLTRSLDGGSGVNRPKIKSDLEWRFVS